MVRYHQIRRGLGALLSRGLGDTLRVSLTADPEEVKAGWAILSALVCGKGDPSSFRPTCGRTGDRLRRKAAEVEKRLSDFLPCPSPLLWVAWSMVPVKLGTLIQASRR